MSRPLSFALPGCSPLVMDMAAIPVFGLEKDAVIKEVQARKLSKRRRFRYSGRKFHALVARA